MEGSRRFTFLVLFCITSIILLRVFESSFDADTNSLRSVAPKRRNLGLLTQYNDPKAVVKKSSENVQPLTSDEITPPATDFIFLVAIEGSGHHMNQALFEKSPANERIVKLKVRPHVNDMLTSLYNNQDKSQGLFSAATARDDPDGVNVVEILAEKLRIVDAKIRTAHPYPQRTMVPLNAGGIALGTTGMMSYPNFHGRDRAMQYPDLNTLYYACDVAGVSCRHVVLTRNPYAVIRSTTMNREFSSKHMAIQMYTTMLDVILAQSLMHPDRLAGCWEYGAVADEELGLLMGWDDSNEGMDSFRHTYASLFQGDEDMDSSEKLEIVPQELEVYMLSMELATNRVRSTCRDILQSQREALSA